MTVVAWRAYYTDGRAFVSTDTDWRALPDDGVLVVVLYYDRFSGRDNSVRHRLVLDGEDWYWHVPDTQRYGATTDPRDRVRERYPGAVLKRGKWTTDDTYYAVKQRAYDAACPLLEGDPDPDPDPDPEAT